MPGRKVRDVMTGTVISVRHDTEFKHIVDALVDAEVSALPVVDEDRKVQGVVSEADLLYKLEFAGTDVHRRLLERRRARTAKSKAAGDTAADLMTSPAVTIGADAPLAEAARVMDRERVKRLPVVDAGGRLTGIVSRRDLLRPYLRADAEIRHDVMTEVLDRSLWLEPDVIHVEVSRGRVILSGRADRRSTAQIAVPLTGAIDGVVAVVDELTWAFDDTVERVRRREYDDILF